MQPLLRRHLLSALAAALIAGGPGVGVASAKQPRQEQPRVQLVERGNRPPADRSLSDAVRRVQRETGGRILGAERVPYDGRDINRVKYMDDRGRVRYMDDPSPSRAGPRDRQADEPPRGDNS